MELATSYTLFLFLQVGSILAPNPGIYVKNAIATLGYQDTTHGYWAHSLLFFLTDQYPSSIMLAIFKILNKKTYENAFIAKQKDN